MQNPTSRFHKEGTLSLNWTKNDPYLRGSIVATPFDWMEASFQYTDINNELYSDDFNFSGNQTFKDKSFDAKFKILNEGDYLPSVSLGFRDLGGTGRFSGEYLVASKFIKNIDFHLGLGWGTLSGGKSISNPLTRISDQFLSRENDVGEGGQFSTATFFRGEEAGIFGGMEIYLQSLGLRGSRIKIEYDSTNYSLEGKSKIFSSSKINYGLVYPVSDSFHLRASFLRGDEFSIGFTFNGFYKEKNKSVTKLDRKTELNNVKEIKIVTSQSDRYLYLATLRYLQDTGFSLKSANVDENEKKYQVAFSQSKYFNHALATGRLVNLLDQISPENITDFELTAVNAGLPMHAININRKDYLKSEISNSHYLVKASSSISSPKESFDEDYSFKPKTRLPAHFLKIGPGIRSQIGGPDGFFLGQLLISLDSELLLKRNLNIQTIAQYGIADSFDDLKLASDSVLPHVRTEIVNYLKQGRKSNITRMQFNYFRKPSKNIYFKFSAGIFEEMFGGAGYELLYRPVASNLAIGLEMFQVKQRTYRQLFKFQDYSTLTGHISFYYREPRSNVLIRLSGGRYLAKDSGFTLDFSRRFKSGTSIGAYFSRTDISSFEFGEGSFDKGFYFAIPLQAFFSNYRTGYVPFGLRPMTRDGAARLIVGHDLWGVTDQSSKSNILFGWDEFHD